MGSNLRWLAKSWLLKYIIYEIMRHETRKIKVTTSLQTLGSLR